MIRRITIPDILQPVSHYCHVAEAKGIIWISGLVGMRHDGTIPENTAEQFDIAMEDFNTCLIAAGGKFSTVTKVRVFLTDINDRGYFFTSKQVKYYYAFKRSFKKKMNLPLKNMLRLF